MRCCDVPVLLLAGTLLLGAPTAAAEAPPPEPTASGTILARLDDGLQVRMDGLELSVQDSGEGLFRLRLLSWSPMAEVASDPSQPVARGFSWSYPHLQDILFLDLRAAIDPEALPALWVEPASGLDRVSRSIRPHDGMGSFGARPVRFWQLVSEIDGGRRYTALVRLDQSPGTAHDDDVYSFERSDLPPEDAAWPLAVVRAPTQRELLMRIGQALLAFDGAGERNDPKEWWRVPALCGLCQQQRVREVELDLQDRGSSLLLHVRTEMEYPDHARASAEGMRIEDQSLAPWLSGQQDDEAWFVVPLEVPLADVLMRVAATGDARVRARLSTGTTVDVPTVRVQLDPAFEERLYSLQKRAEAEEWPNHLASDLVSSWPNPFRDATTIEVTVPATIEEAFELEPELLARVEPRSPPPFGTNPMVRVKVYNVSGQLVNVLDQGPRPVGRFTVGWTGQDLQGRPVASGAYYVHVEMDEWSVTRRVLLLRN